MIKKILALSIFALVTFGCDSDGGSKLDIKISGTDSVLNITSSGSLASTKTFSSTKDGQTVSTKAPSHYFAMANSILIQVRE